MALLVPSGSRCCILGRCTRTLAGALLGYSPCQHLARNTTRLAFSVGQTLTPLIPQSNMPPALLFVSASQSSIKFCSQERSCTLPYCTVNCQLLSLLQVPEQHRLHPAPRALLRMATTVLLSTFSSTLAAGPLRSHACDSADQPLTLDSATAYSPEDACCPLVSCTAHFSTFEL